MKSAKILQPIFFEDWCNKVSLPSVVHRFSPPAVVLLSSEPSLGSVKVKLCKLMEKLRKDYESERGKRTLHFFSSLGFPPSCLAASASSLSTHTYCRSTVTQKQNNRELAVYHRYQRLSQKLLCLNYCIFCSSETPVTVVIILFRIKQLHVLWQGFMLLLPYFPVFSLKTIA